MLKLRIICFIFSLLFKKITRLLLLFMKISDLWIDLVWLHQGLSMMDLPVVGIRILPCIHLPQRPVMSAHEGLHFLLPFQLGASKQDVKSGFLTSRQKEWGRREEKRICCTYYVVGSILGVLNIPLFYFLDWKWHLANNGDIVYIYL